MINMFFNKVCPVHLLDKRSCSQQGYQTNIDNYDKLFQLIERKIKLNINMEETLCSLKI